MKTSLKLATVYSAIIALKAVNIIDSIDEKLATLELFDSEFEVSAKRTLADFKTYFEDNKISTLLDVAVKTPQDALDFILGGEDQNLKTLASAIASAKAIHDYAQANRKNPLKVELIPAEQVENLIHTRLQGLLTPKFQSFIDIGAMANELISNKTSTIAIDNLVHQGTYVDDQAITRLFYQGN